MDYSPVWHSCGRNLTELRLVNRKHSRTDRFQVNSHTDSDCVCNIVYLHVAYVQYAVSVSDCECACDCVCFACACVAHAVSVCVQPHVLILRNLSCEKALHRQITFTTHSKGSRTKTSTNRTFHKSVCLSTCVYRLCKQKKVFFTIFFKEKGFPTNIESSWCSKHGKIDKEAPRFW